MTKMKAFFSENCIEDIEILNNNCFLYEGVAICGTRGWMTEGEVNTEHNTKIMSREASRLRASLQAAGDADVKLCFLHYPPRFNNLVCEDLVTTMNDYGVRNCWYGHVHGQGHRLAVRGEIEGIIYEMISADFLDFVPKKIM